MLLYVSDEIVRNKDYLGEIDAKIGDGDHGAGMALGFTKAKETLLAKNPKTINECFTTVGMSMIASMGGASGIVFGTMFSAGVKGLAPTEEIGLSEFASIMQQALKAVQDRGKAQVGDKTMVDAFSPAVDALLEGSKKGLSLAEGLEKAATAAELGVESTKPLVAKYGRAKSLMERAIGYQDAGATSVSIIFKAMFDWTKNNQ
jgi:dihydroxyacetone kinase-like protein